GGSVTGPGGFSVGGATESSQGGRLADPFEDEAALASVAGSRVELRGLDKLTGDVATFEAPVGGDVAFDRLRIEVKACFSRPAARAPESSVFLQIFDTKPEPDAMSFSGWMFASSPALSAMDHPRYDVWVLSCKTS
ncbi:MAG: DUF2155 domain-containing protein, partial [Pseudomonadota bacterium]